MTDQERASAFVRDWTGESDLSPEPLAETVDTLARHFAAVRLDERRAIVAWLQRRADLDGIEAAVYADEIERGAHL